MAPETSSCDRNRLKLLLNDQLTLREARHTEEHLDQCPTCRRDLEWMAADPHWWRDASEFLRLASDEPTQSVALSSSSRPDEGAQSSQHNCGCAMEPTTFDVVLEYLEPGNDPALLGRLGGYEILEVIGQGGMGIVLKGFDRELHRYVAIKVLAPHFAGSAAARQRFAREAQAAAAIVHPHVVPIHSVDVAGPLPYLVMPLLSGQSLEQRLEKEGPLPLPDILRIGLQAAEGLAAAHAQGLVHRDVKPANILLEKGVNRVLLTDFGLARAVDDATLTRSGIIAGTPQYMSPEQARGDAVDCRSDLFSLGSVLYAMCTGHSPFRAETWMGVLRRICDNQPRPVREINPDIPQWLEILISQLHSKAASERLQSAGEVARLLEQCLAHVHQPLANPLPESIIPRPPQKKRWHTLQQRWLVIAGSVGLLVMLSAAALLMNPLQRASPPAAESATEGARTPATADASTERSMAEPTDAELDWHSSIEQDIFGLHQSLNLLELQTGGDSATMQ